MMSQHVTLSTTVMAFIGGFLPALIWLWFWLKEDEDPEPRHLILLAFVAGMLSIPVALFFEKLLLQEFLPLVRHPGGSLSTLASAGTLLLGSAFIEECAKLLAVAIFIFWRVEYDEPADAMIYMITAALGFAAFENALYLQKPFAYEIFQGLTVINLRFIGATLLHALSSGFLGYFIAKAFLQGKIRKEIAILIGLILATLLHALFNLSILVTGFVGGSSIEPALAILIAAGVLILFSFERIKHTIH